LRLGIVADEPAIAANLRKAATLTAEHRVIWIATTDDEAVARCLSEEPDLVLMHVRLGGLNAVEATRRIMSIAPCAILVVTAEERANSGQVFEAMGEGAVDAIDLPSLDGGAPIESGTPLMKKIAIISWLILDKNRSGDPADRKAVTSSGHRCDQMVAIGASAGGPQALATLLGGLPGNFPAAIVVVQHVDAQFAIGMAQWLSRHCGLPVSVAKEGDRPAAGRVLIAGTSDHLTMKTPDTLGYTSEPRHFVYRPSIDVFFESLDQLWQGELVGVLLTGMGKDGAAGLKTLRNQGHHTIAQDEASCAVYGMPKAAARLNAAVEILPVNRIAAALAEAFSLPSPGPRRTQPYPDTCR
jgi:two-component system response regulator WspF